LADDLIIAEFVLNSGPPVKEQIMFLDEYAPRIAELLDGEAVTYARYIEDEKYTVLFRVPATSMARFDISPADFTQYVIEHTDAPMDEIKSVSFVR
jgi:hypothetical protein